MKNSKENIDLLLQKNTTLQLEKVNWPKLNATISARLDEVETNELAAARKRPAFFKLAAGLSAAAAIIFIVLLIKINTPDQPQKITTGTAVVKLIDEKTVSSAIVTQPKSESIVNITPDKKQLATCDVKIIDLNGLFDKGENRPACIIITRQQPALVDNGLDRDEIDFICLW